jgi:hypothetical protein
MQHDAPDPQGHAEATTRLIESAEALGVEIDREEAERWIAAMSAESYGSVSVDVNTGIYGHRVTLADHDATELERFRRMAAIVGFEDRPPAMVTALALAGSAAQSRIHRFPADADFFERVHVRAATREEACRILADVIRDKALATLHGQGTGCRRSSSAAGRMTGRSAASRSGQANPCPGHRPRWKRAGSTSRGRWGERPVALGGRRVIPAGASSTGSSPTQSTGAWPTSPTCSTQRGRRPTVRSRRSTASSIPTSRRSTSTPTRSRSSRAWSRSMGADSVADYVERLTDEVYKYTVKEPNYGKAARRMYNIFRLTGRYPEAAYIRELFDEPTTALYQVAALLRALDEAADAGDAFETDALVVQVDGLIMSAISALEGHAETEMVRRLLRLRDAISSRAGSDRRTEDIAGVRDDAVRAVNDYFERVLTAIPSIKGYLDIVAATRVPR